MDKVKTKPKAKLQLKSESDILSIYDLDTVLKIASNSKQQIAEGKHYTVEESVQLIMNKREELIKGK